jgi:hypothetical protein
MLAGALIRAKLKTELGGEQRVAALDAVGEGGAADPRQLLKLAPAAMLGRRRKLVAFAVQAQIDERRVLAQPSLMRGVAGAAVRLAVAATFHAPGLSPETGDRA